MDIIACADMIKAMYRGDIAQPDDWGLVINDFVIGINRESDLRVLEKCVLEDGDWELPVDERMMILRKAKDLGASSLEFLIDYYGYLSAHLDSGDEKNDADRNFMSIYR